MAPIGPWITPSEFIADPHNLAIQLWVNDELMQNASSRQMYFTIPEQIEYLIDLLTLLPGDVVATGTPPGVGHARGLYLKPGDAVTITIEGLGSIRNLGMGRRSYLWLVAGLPFLCLFKDATGRYVLQAVILRFDEVPDPGACIL